MDAVAPQMRCPSQRNSSRRRRRPCHSTSCSPTFAGSYLARPDPSEVAEAFEVPLPFVLDPANVGEREVDWQGRRRRLLEFRWNGHHIWGATASMLVNFRQRLEEAR